MSDFTISQVARHLGITPQALYKREDFLKEKGYLYYKDQPNGKPLKLVTTEGLNYLVAERTSNLEGNRVSSKPVERGLNNRVDNRVKPSLNQEQSVDNSDVEPKEDFIDYNNPNQVLKLLLASKDNEIKSLTNQVNSLNKIIADLRETNKSLNLRIDAYINTHLLSGEVDKNYKRPSFFSRLFGKNKAEPKTTNDNILNNSQETNEVDL